MESTEAPACVCLGDCPEAAEENPCAYCRGLDPYDPCLSIGFGCGWSTEPCDCCTPEQRAAAASGVAS